MKNIKLIVVDHDNTISKIYPNPGEFWMDVFINAIQECGGHCPEERKQELMVSYYSNDPQFSEKMKILGMKKSMEDFEEVKARLDEQARARHVREGNAYIFEDARKLFSYMKEKGIKLAVATFTRKDVVNNYMTTQNHMTTSRIFDWDDMVKTGWKKPNPNILKQITSELGVSLEETVMIGDRLSDVELGRRAGCFTVMVKRPEEDMELVGKTDQVINNLRNNDPESYKIPDMEVFGLDELIPWLEENSSVIKELE